MPSDLPAVDPDDIPHIDVLRDDLNDAFRATKRRYLDRGADEQEARELAEGYVRQRLKDATLDLGPDVEAVTVREVFAYMGRWKWTVWLTALAALAGWSYALIHVFGD